MDHTYERKRAFQAIAQNVGALQPYGLGRSCSGRLLRKKRYESVEALQRDLDEWLLYYNTERTNQGYRNMGGRPRDG
jgi:hypothetical protein